MPPICQQSWSIDWRTVSSLKILVVCGVQADRYLLLSMVNENVNNNVYVYVVNVIWIFIWTPVIISSDMSWKSLTWHVVIFRALDSIFWDSGLRVSGDWFITLYTVCIVSIRLRSMAFRSLTEVFILMRNNAMQNRHIFAEPVRVRSLACLPAYPHCE